jgi:hypothetical protein
MNIIIIALVVLIVISLLSGFIGSREMSLGIEINKWSTPFFKLGLTSERFSLDDGSVEDEIGVHLLFISFVVIFWKPLD